MAKTISYIDNRIISNTGSMSTSIGDHGQASYLNSFSDISQMGPKSINPADKIDNSYFYNQDKLIEINSLPPFEMSMTFTEYFSDHTAPNFQGRESSYTIPFSPLNTEFFAKSMVFSSDLKLDSETAKSKYAYTGKENEDYFKNYLTKYPSIPPAILFAASLPIDTKKLPNLIYDDLKIPGMKQVPYTFALWLGSKWHYYKHKNQIFLGQKNWNIGQPILDKPKNNTSLLHINGSKISINLIDLENYTHGAYVYSDIIVGYTEKAYSYTPPEWTDKGLHIPVSGDYTVVRKFNAVANEFKLDNYGGGGSGRYHDYFDYYYNYECYPKPLLSLGDFVNEDIVDFYNKFTISFVLPTSSFKGDGLNNVVETGIGINSILLTSTYNYLEDTNIGTTKSISDMISVGAINNIKHYEFGFTTRDKEGIPIYFNAEDSISKVYINKQIKLNDFNAITKIDIINKHYGGTWPGLFPLNNYPKYANTRTVDINAIYSVTNFFDSNINTIEVLAKSNKKENVFNAVNGEKNTVKFYNSFRNYILYNKKINEKYINQVIKEAYDNGGVPTNLFELLDRIKDAKFNITNDDFIELMLMILMQIDSVIDKNDIINGIADELGVKTSIVKSKYDKLKKIAASSNNKEFAKIKIKSILRTNTVNKQTIGKSDSRLDISYTDQNYAYKLIYPKLLMDLYHGYIELSSPSAIGFAPISKTNIGEGVISTNIGMPSKKSAVIFSNSDRQSKKYVLDKDDRSATEPTYYFEPTSFPSVNANLYPLTSTSLPLFPNRVVPVQPVIKPTDVIINTPDSYMSNFGKRSSTYRCLKLFICRVYDRLLQEQANNILSIDQFLLKNGGNNDAVVAKLYPSAGGTVNLNYGMNTHLYTDIIIPNNKLNNEVIGMTSRRSVGVKTLGSTQFQQIATVIDPRVMRNYRPLLYKRAYMSNGQYSDTLLKNNLENIRNSGLRYLWYSGPYFGVPTAQLSLDNIILSTNNQVNNRTDFSTVPRTNYDYSELIDFSVVRDFNINDLKDFPQNTYKSVYEYFGLYRDNINRYGAIPTGLNTANYLSFDTIIQQLGSDMLNQFESVFLDFCKTENNVGGVINFDGVMKLLMRVDDRDLSDELCYVSNYDDKIVGGDPTALSVDEKYLTVLTIDQQKEILKLQTIESDVDLINYVGEPNNFDTDIKMSENSERNTLGYLKNIVLTKGQYNKAVKVLDFLGSKENDVYVKRNWIQNSSENNLVKFYTDPENIKILSTLVLDYSTTGLENKLANIYSKYITSLFDSNYVPSGDDLNWISSDLFSSDYLPESVVSNYGSTDSYWENRAKSFMRLLMIAFNQKTIEPYLSTASTEPNIEAAFYNYINKIKGTESYFFKRTGKVSKAFADLNYLRQGDQVKITETPETEAARLNVITTVSHDDPFLYFLEQFASAEFKPIKMYEEMLIKPFDYAKPNRVIIGNLMEAYRAIIRHVIKPLNVKKDSGNTSWYYQTYIDEIEQLILKAIQSYMLKSTVPNTVRLTLAEFDTAIYTEINNFMAASYRNVGKYFNAHISSLVYVLQSSSLSQNISNDGLSYDDKSRISSEALKTKPYYNIKKIHDSWMYTDVVTESKNSFYYLTYYDKPCYLEDSKIKTVDKNNVLFGSYFHIVDRGNNDIGDDLLLDIDWLYKYMVESIEGKKVFFNQTSLESSMYTFFGDMAKAHNCLFHALPSFNGIGLSGKSGKNTLATEMFKTYNYLQYKENAGPHFILQYIGDVTSTLENSKNSNVRIKNDKRNSFCLENQNDTPPDIRKNMAEGANPVTGFVVQFGEQNQQIFSDIVLDQAEFSNTEEYFDVITNLTKNGEVKTVGNNLFKIYDARSYTATITGMGNMEIEPMMYFYLKNVPLFRGTYWITNVSHEIVANQIKTTFKGVRQPIATVKPSKELFAQLKKENIERAKNSSVVTNVITIDSDKISYDEKLLPSQYTLGDLSKNAYYSHDIVAQVGLTVQEIANNLSNVANTILERIKIMFPEHAIVITSGFRKKNADSNDISQHHKGEAVDIQFEGLPAKSYTEIANTIINSDMPYDQIIFENKPEHKSIVLHISAIIAGTPRRKFGTQSPTCPKKQIDEPGVIHNYYA